MNAQQELFTKVRSLLVGEFGEGNVFDGKMPPDDTPYPFIYIGETDSNDIYTKTELMGSALIYVYVWHDNPMKRGTVSDWLERASQLLRSIEDTNSHHFTLTSLNQRIRSNEGYMQGIITAGYTFS